MLTLNAYHVKPIQNEMIKGIAGIKYYKVYG
jgi:hypothetical protein